MMSFTHYKTGAMLVGQIALLLVPVICYSAEGPTPGAPSATATVAAPSPDAVAKAQATWDDLVKSVGAATVVRCTGAGLAVPNTVGHEIPPLPYKPWEPIIVSLSQQGLKAAFGTFAGFKPFDPNKDGYAPSGMTYTGSGTNASGEPATVTVCRPDSGPFQLIVTVTQGKRDMLSDERYFVTFGQPR